LLQQALTSYDAAGKPVPRKLAGGVESADQFEVSWVGSYALSLPSAQPEPEKPVLNPKQVSQLNQYDEVWRSFAGTGLAAIGAVSVGTTRLTINAD
jgi:hypothetical protein